MYDYMYDYIHGGIHVVIHACHLYPKYTQHACYMLQAYFSSRGMLSDYRRIHSLYIVRILSELRIKLHVVHVLGLVVGGLAALQYLFLLGWQPLDAREHVRFERLVLTVPGFPHGTGPRVMQEPLLLLLRGRAVAQVYDVVRAVHLDVHDAGVAGVGALVEGGVDVATEAVNLSTVVGHLPRLLLDEVEGVLLRVVDDEGEGQEVRSVEYRREHVFVDGVRGRNAGHDRFAVGQAGH